MRAAKGQLGLLAVEERGPLFEGLVANCLRAWNDYRGLYDELSYWAPTESRGLDHHAWGGQPLHPIYGRR